jgi:hypothetical protein
VNDNIHDSYSEGLRIGCPSRTDRVLTLKEQGSCIQLNIQSMSPRKHRISVTKVSSFTTFRKITNVYSENLIKPINTLCRIKRPVPMILWSKACTVFNRLNIKIVDLNPA